MIGRKLRRDLRTRVPAHIYDRVEVYAAAHTITVYEAVERLVLVGLDAAGSATGAQQPDSGLAGPVAQLVAKVDLLASLTDRAVFAGMVAYSYARNAALKGLEGDERVNQDRSILATGQDAYTRQRSRALGS